MKNRYLTLVLFLVLLLSSSNIYFAIGSQVVEGDLDKEIDDIVFEVLQFDLSNPNIIIEDGELKIDLEEMNLDLIESYLIGGG